MITIDSRSQGFGSCFGTTADPPATSSLAMKDSVVQDIKKDRVTGGFN